MADIQIAPLGSGHFRVKVADASSESVHDVAVGAGTIEKLNWKSTPEELIRRSFAFLLEREPKESILPAFDIEQIGSYFPEWEGLARAGFAQP